MKKFYSELHELLDDGEELDFDKLIMKSDEDEEDIEDVIHKKHKIDQ